MYLKQWTDPAPRQIHTAPLPLNEITYRQGLRERKRREAERQMAEDDGVLVGFFYGAAATALLWLFLSGILIDVLRALVVTAVAVAGGAR